MEGREDPRKWLESFGRGRRPHDAVIHGEERVVELELFLLMAEAAALEEAAWRRSLTLGQMMRQLVRDFLNQSLDRLPPM